MKREGIAQAFIDDLTEARLLPVIGWGYPDFVQVGVPRSDDQPDSRAARRAAREWLESYGPHVWPLFHMIAAIPFRNILAFTPDPALAKILEYYDPEWLALGSHQADYPEGRRLLVPLGGVMSDPDSLNLPGIDYVSLRWRRPILWRHAEGMARAPLLVLGCSSTDHNLLRLVARLRPYPPFETAGWIVSRHVAPRDRQMWEALGFDVLEMAPANLLRRAYGFAAMSLTRRDLDGPQTKRPWHRAPYKNLYYFDRDDVEIFFGRDVEKRQLIDLVSSHRLVVVTGPSGAGKTSLLNAGLLATLDKRADENTIYARVENDPVSAIRHEVGQVVRGVTRTSTDDESLSEFLRKALRVSRKASVIVLDQAEELFTRVSPELRDELFDALRECLVSPSLIARFVLSLREDFLPKLAGYRDVLPSLLNNTFVVRELSRAEATQAIQGPAAKAAITLDDDVVDEILRDLGIERFPPPQIQIICSALYDARRRSAIDRALYAELGGARSILKGFLAKGLVGLGRDEPDARKVLKAMVTSEGTKDVLSPHAIATRAGLAAERVNNLLLHLRDNARVLRSVPLARGHAFELAHEYLTTEIWSWMSDVDIKRREIEDMLDREVRSWRRFRHLRLGVDRLVVCESNYELLRIDEEGLTILLLGAVKHARNVQMWAVLVHRLGVEAERRVAHVLLEYFAERDLRQRREAAEAIAVLAPEALVESLRSERWRKPALEMVGGMEIESALPQVLESLDDRDPEVRALTCGVLGEIGTEKALDVLIRASADRDEVVSFAAIKAAGRIPNGLGCAVVAKALQSGSKSTERVALDSLRQSRDSGLVTKLLLDASLTGAAKEALWKCIAAGSAQLNAWTKGVLEKLPTQDLLMALTSRHLDTEAMRVIERRPDASPKLVQRARETMRGRYLHGIDQERWERVCRDVARDLGENADAEALRKRLTASDWAVAAATFNWLVDNGRRMNDVMRAILKIAGDSATPKVAAAVALLKEAILFDRHEITDLLADKRPGVRYLACKIAAKCGDKSLVDVLRQLSDDHAVIGELEWHGAIPGSLKEVWNSRDTVSTAAHEALDALWPISKVWRKGFQETFR